MENQESTVPSVTTRSAGIRYGLIMGVFSIVYFLVLNTLGADITQGPASWGRYLYVAVFIFLAHKYYKDNGDSFMSYGQGIGISFWMGLVSSVISSIFTFIYVKFIDQGFVQQIIDRTREGMEEKGTMSEEQVDQAMAMASKFMTPEMMLVFGLVFGILGSIFIALIVTIFTQKKNPEPFV
jgi:hypothetical protein